jgi:hypothetical protein
MICNPPSGHEFPKEPESLGVDRAAACPRGSIGLAPCPRPCSRVATYRKVRKNPAYALISTGITSVTMTWSRMIARMCFDASIVSLASVARVVLESY